MGVTTSIIYTSQPQKKFIFESTQRNLQTKTDDWNTKTKRTVKMLNYYL